MMDEILKNFGRTTYRYFDRLPAVKTRKIVRPDDCLYLYHNYATSSVHKKVDKRVECCDRNFGSLLKFYEKVSNSHEEAFVP